MNLLFFLLLLLNCQGGKKTASGEKRQAEGREDGFDYGGASSDPPRTLVGSKLALQGHVNTEKCAFANAPGRLRVCMGRQQSATETTAHKGI